MLQILFIYGASLSVNCLVCQDSYLHFKRLFNQNLNQEKLKELFNEECLIFGEAYRPICIDLFEKFKIAAMFQEKKHTEQYVCYKLEMCEEMGADEERKAHKPEKVKRVGTVSNQTPSNHESPLGSIAADLISSFFKVPGLSKNTINNVVNQLPVKEGLSKIQSFAKQITKMNESIKARPPSEPVSPEPVPVRETIPETEEKETQSTPPPIIFEDTI